MCLAVWDRELYPMQVYNDPDFCTNVALNITHNVNIRPSKEWEIDNTFSNEISKARLKITAMLHNLWVTWHM